MTNKKLTSLKKWLIESKIDCILLNDPENIAYYSGFKSEPHERILALVIFPFADPFLFTPSLEIKDAQNSEWPFSVYGYLDNENPWSILSEKIQSATTSTGHFAIEKAFLTVERYEKLCHFFKNSLFKNISEKIQEMKLIKDSSEIKKMIEAGEWADKALEIGFNSIKEGISEEEIVAEIEFQLKKQGMKEMSFETMVLTGDHAASPHGVPGARKVKKDDMILFDLGVVHNGYTSDVTRMAIFGNPSKEAEKVYSIVLRAHQAAIAAVKPGVTAGQLDEIARNIITKEGYGEYFTHRLGHGLGSSVHEFPSIMKDSELIIKEGMCFSIEPGIYIPGIVGVRIEDCLYVTKNGCELFTKTPTTFKSIG
ncbi:Xaa-Pro dipeptidase [Carnobacterium iners]|uniref:Xaa-Pro dipeptidase n=1 Tax=Carnobacterium iners TaxID=1073423 RepID=A0A1X7NSS7_9LACT|nr:Xaa-Pro peptidase family protein [Carnobacterium iners]SEK88446.1 Xaa-Pro dipeptidase [Carnobacterium iners]SMH40743.1 Xaa-Pro dipeptidase [Carnobacterium iners]